MAEQYGVWGEKKNYGKTYMGIVRSTFVIDADGKLKKVMRNVKPDDARRQGARRARGLTSVRTAAAWRRS